MLNMVIYFRDRPQSHDLVEHINEKNLQDYLLQLDGTNMLSVALIDYEVGHFFLQKSEYGRFFVSYMPLVGGGSYYLIDGSIDKDGTTELRFMLENGAADWYPIYKTVSYNIAAGAALAFMTKEPFLELFDWEKF